LEVSNSEPYNTQSLFFIFQFDLASIISCQEQLLLTAEGWCLPVLPQMQD